MLEVRNLRYCWPGRSQLQLQGVSLCIAPGEVLGLRAPSGYGKTTLARLLAAHLPWQDGTLRWAGQPMAPPVPGQAHGVQLVMQHAELAFNPRLRVRHSLGPHVSSAVFTPLGIQPAWLTRRPHELSGGELQRLAIARALVPGLKLLIMDEATAMHDAISQARIWRFMLGQVRMHSFAMLVLTHDTELLKVVANRIVELSTKGELDAL